MAARLILRQDCSQPQAWPPHIVPAGHQGQGVWGANSDGPACGRRRSSHPSKMCRTESRTKEPNLEMLARGKIRYEAPRYMSINTAVEQLLEVEDRRKEGAFSGETLAIGIARLQADDQVWHT
eukprot:364991-Chlamydomonas_euryale.AAC.5